MTVVRRQAQRRWTLVGAAVAVLCLLPAAVAAWPQPGVTADPVKLRDQILRSAGLPYQGYADLHGETGLPDLPMLGEFAQLLGGTTRVRVWHASAQSWRIATFTATGETDTYRSATGTHIWDFERNLLTQTVGEAVRLPSAADLMAPDLARRLLREMSPADRLEAAAARRVAGVAAAGLRWIPSDPDTTVGLVQVWADPATGLPLRVEVASRAGRTAFTSHFLDLDQRAPSAELLVPSRPSSAGFSVTTAQDVASALRGVGATALPATLAGRQRLAAPAEALAGRGVAAYGAGVSLFAVVTLPGRIGSQSLQAVHEGGGVTVAIGGAEAYEMQTALVNALIMRTPGTGRNRRTYLLAGSVTAEVLRQAGADLLATGQVRP
ncbi:hypothetical protein Rhe02_42290 [Rhizocola hellebori]|uniref:Transcriptional regulator n=1 Tax=Rhizocola hellebori TaxID=1392758 RepID=A0A8J3VHE3_9ACTN|nr:hypothetical protein [Rhizocola hellebori]GIH06162.1 hypothetical protein Rhe02_42290 [Rhizocola hellebori]